jgi:hypothetical protein
LEDFPSNWLRRELVKRVAAETDTHLDAVWQGSREFDLNISQESLNLEVFPDQKENLESDK